MTDKCGTEMGCNGEKCIWSATRRSCRNWCREHANGWASSVIDLVVAAQDDNSPALLVIDRLNIVGQKGMFLRSDQFTKVLPRLVGEDCSTPQEVTDMVRDYVSPYRLHKMTMIVTAYGLEGSPPDSVVSAWENQYTFSDELEFVQWMGFKKKGISVSYLGDDSGKFLMRSSTGSVHVLDRDTVAAQLGALMSDSTLKGTRLMFTFHASVVGWTLADMIAACDAVDVRMPQCTSVRSYSGFGGRNFSYGAGGGTALGGVHVSLDGGGDCVAQWHTFAHISANFPLGRSRVVSFHVVMLW
jgi:hypothetical protein